MNLIKKPGFINSVTWLALAGAHIFFALSLNLCYNSPMSNDTTIATTSPIGQHLEKVAEGAPVSYLMFNQKRINLVAKMTIGRNPDCSIVIDNKLASRHHATIQKIRDAFFLKDEKSTNGTFLNGQRIPPDKYVKLNPGDKITVGAVTLVMS